MATLTEYEAYSLDVSGYIVLPAVLTEAELADVRTDADGAAVAALGTSYSSSMFNWVNVGCAVFIAGNYYLLIRGSR